MPRVKRLLLVILALVAGCATADLAETRQQWQGAAYDDVVRRWGAPARSATLQDGAQVHTWVTEAYERAGSPSVGVGVFGGTGGGGGIGVGMGFPFGSGGEARRCERTLIFKDGVVVDQNWTGPANYCNTFGRG